MFHTTIELQGDEKSTFPELSICEDLHSSRMLNRSQSRAASTYFSRWAIIFLLVFPASVVAFSRGFFEVNQSRRMHSFRSRNPSPLLAVDKRQRTGGRTQFVGGDDRSSTGSNVPKIPKVFLNEFEQIKRDIAEYQEKNDYHGALNGIQRMFHALELAGNERNRLALCEVVDSTFQSYLVNAFASPYRGKHNERRISSGMKVMVLQLSSSGVFEPPYDTVPKRILLCALKALTSSRKYQRSSEGNVKTHIPSDTAYRLLQRLVTGTGIRHFNYKNPRIREHDFNMVMNAYANVGRMDMVERVMALQERTVHAPQVSAVAYSILLKGYGRLRDTENVNNTLEHAKRNRIIPDTIMLNSLIDAYVNCNQLSQAYEVFNFMVDPAKGDENSDLKLLVSSNGAVKDFPRPNKRTYNTLLKGFAYNGELDKAITYAKEMERLGLWDHVTTNTLVQAAVASKNFTFAEEILQEHTDSERSSAPSSMQRRHPNVEAYTNLLDGYAKAGEMQKTLSTLRLMEQRGVNPNEVTYTCIIRALAERKKIDAAKKMMTFMLSKGLRPSAITYNSFISGLVSDDDDTVVSEKGARGLSFDSYVDEAVSLLRQMMREGVGPNAITVSVIIDAFGRCDVPRVEQAKALVAKLEGAEFITVNNTKIATALIQVCGVGRDLPGALDAFRRITKPDAPAVNAFLDACVKCDKHKIALDTFVYYFRTGAIGSVHEGTDVNSGRNLEPDVISYTIMISSLLEQKNHMKAAEQSLQLYQEMRKFWHIKVDNALVDVVLKAVVQRSREGKRLDKPDIELIIHVLRDAVKLKWGKGQFERRKRAVKAVISGRSAATFQDQAELYELLATVDDDDDDELFRRHGWNKVNSGFRFFDTNGDGTPIPPSSNLEDEFLQSKGWNNVDSGFRII